MKLPRYKKGKFARERIPVPGSPILLNLVALYGKLPGPNLLVVGAIHGNEALGVEIIGTLLQTIKPNDLSGNLLMVPVLNVPAADVNQRVNPDDEQDMNRVFPGNPSGTTTERIAHTFFHEILPLADVVLDLHTTDFPEVMVPHVRVRLKEQSDRHRELVASTGLLFQWRGPEISGMLQVEAAKLGIPCATLELGHSAEVSEKGVTLGLETIMNVMKVLGMIPGRARIPNKQVVIHHKQPWIASILSGVSRILLSPGDGVCCGDPLLEVFNISSLERMKLDSPISGIVAGVNRVPMIRSRTPLVLIVPLEEENIVNVPKLPNSDRDYTLRRYSRFREYYWVPG